MFAEDVGLLKEQLFTDTLRDRATQQTWTKDFKDQLAAIRDLLRTQGGEWNVDTIANQFANASRSKSKIQDAIDALETLGIVTQHTEANQITWYFTDLQTMSNR